MSKAVVKQDLKTEALKLALEALEYIDRQDNDRDFLRPEECCDLDDAITAIREALAEQGCEFCSHPLYAGTKCKNCGREQPAQQDMPKIGCVNHDCDQCKAQQQEPYGQVTVVRRPGCVDQHWFYRWPEPPYLDNAAECHTVYTSPPASKPLTFSKLCDIEYEITHRDGDFSILKFARAIEAAHGIKGDA